MQEFIDWLYATPVSTTIREVTWIIPAVQTIHIIALSLLFGSALFAQLRIAGVFARDTPLPDVLGRYLPWIWRCLAVLLATGMVMIVGEPDRVMLNLIFWTKMGLVAAMALVVRVLFVPASRPVGQGGAALAVSPLVAWLGLLAWVLIIACGRWIAYY